MGDGVKGLVSDLVQLKFEPLLCFSKQLYKDKEKDEGLSLSFEADVNVSRGNPTFQLGDTSLVMKTSTKAYDTKHGPLLIKTRTKYSGKALAFQELKDAEMTADLVSNFDKQGPGNFKLGLERVEYQRQFPVYLGGPWNGTGACVNVGAQYKYADKSVAPVVGIEDLKVKTNPATIATAAVVAVGLVVAKLQVGAGVNVGVPGVKKGKACVNVGLKKGGRRMYVGVGDLGKFKFEL
mmetsp:Transcript_7021/g.8028  ORF Transcript_7021/g.8028 Transcript_7021/m.8028 type:complete len:236 (+) Transcript_7021:164-871(+)|eukprot:CAMPEP_0197848526 /NCGR_PEP_ID=MMETSP1438-20131217/8994_1 /TAXON_ID=1461541 /ORGANISM="Pterosperma sp., Strain CCMP1384" /LENGTH=235 /DNA_ID=CAMNT_0043460813 /DNA_START=148 /DNA_END=855 /DNA_ORIENTATION=-